MKKNIISICACLLIALSFVSCNNEPAPYVAEAVVTVKGTGGEQCYFQLDEETIVVPENIATNPFGKEVRAITLFQDRGELDKAKDAKMKRRSVSVQYLDSILTKKTVPNLGTEKNIEVYGNDPIDIYRSYMTVVEDGYITLRFCAKWGSTTAPEEKTHMINLVRDTDSKDPFVFELRHNYCSDIDARYGYYRDGVVAFNIKDILARESKGTYNITVKYESELGPRAIVFTYTPGSANVLVTSNDTSLSDTMYR